MRLSVRVRVRVRLSTRCARPAANGRRSCAVDLVRVRVWVRARVRVRAGVGIRVGVGLVSK